MKKILFITYVSTSLLLASTSQEKLGEMLFFEPNLSFHRTQSCATCHNPNSGLSDDRNNTINKMVSLGDDGKSLGDRNAPTASYAMFSPHFHFDKKKQVYKGGQFWDGREKDLEGQAGGPPLNPIEMGMKSKADVLKRIKENKTYITLFEKIYGKNIFKNTEKAYDAMRKAIASFEKTKSFAPFDSKYDRYLRGEYELTPQEELGKALFFSNNNTNCAVCHVLKGEDKEGETFSNYEYHNIGVPKNETLFERNIVKADFIDKGLAKNPKASKKENEGKFKVPTLRNIAVTAPYMHNGVFSNLKTVIAFYDKFNNSERTINPETNKPWSDAEVSHSINHKDLKMKKLSDEKIDAIVAFLKTLTDKKYEFLVK